eukprot:1112290-Pleurochrysis_carterae.AAC.2
MSVLEFRQPGRAVHIARPSSHLQLRVSRRLHANMLFALASSVWYMSAQRSGKRRARMRPFPAETWRARAAADRLRQDLISTDLIRRREIDAILRVRYATVLDVLKVALRSGAVVVAVQAADAALVHVGCRASVAAGAAPTAIPAIPAIPAISDSSTAAVHGIAAGID